MDCIIQSHYWLIEYLKDYTCSNIKAYKSVRLDSLKLNPIGSLTYIKYVLSLQYSNCSIMKQLDVFPPLFHMLSTRPPQLKHVV